MHRIGIDTGGTFTDFVVVRNGRIEVFKELSTPRDPTDAILKGLCRVERTEIQEVIHGSTVATNALLERKGARTALITTAGFEDVLVIGRQTRRELYNIFVTRPDSLVPERLRFGVRERVLYDGSIETPLDLGQVQALANALPGEGIESIAVCLLFSFANPSHENAIAGILERLGIPVSLSSRILPEYREYERTSTTVMNAYLAPLMSRYLGDLEARIGGPHLRVMQSNGGSVEARTVADLPVRAIVSGPAGGVVGAFRLAEMSGYPRIITFDMGGTSTDVSLCDGEIRVTHESQVDGLPVGIPMIDIHTVGAGGGSIADLDPGGALKVGPESAGADPGPICYGSGDRLTVTDANVILGRLLPEFFLGGTMKLWTGRVAPIVKAQPWTRKWRSLEALAQGVVDVVNNNMEQAVRLISVERGHDPRDFALYCFGGAGGLHAVSLARGLGIPRVIVPPHPGALSALGLLLSDARKDYSRTLLLPAGEARARIDKVLVELHRQGERELMAEGFRKDRQWVMDFVDVRYHGQSYELTIPSSTRFVDVFHKTHEQRYGYANPDKDVEVVAVRTTCFGNTEKPRFRRAPLKKRMLRPRKFTDAWIDGRRRRTGVFDRSTLRPGDAISGPAIIGEYSSTTLVPPDAQCSVDGFMNLVIGA